MFIVTFVIGLKTVLNQQRVNNAEPETIRDEDIVQSENNIEREEIEQNKSTLQDNLKEEENYNISENTTQNTIKQETIITDNTNETNTNNFGIGILSVSAIFFIFTIIFMIIFTKYQLKLKKKTSK